MAKARPNALVVLLGPLVTLNSKRIVELALKQHLPGVYPTRQFAEEGGLMAYGPLIGDLYRRLNLLLYLNPEWNNARKAYKAK